jgi:hypothetical protein
VLLVLATDGEPSDDEGNSNLPDFVNFLKSKSANLYVSIVAVTDDKDDIKYLEALDKMPNVDITDDFRAEKAATQAKSGEKFTFGDYICKALLGPIDKSFDALDDTAGAPGGAAGNFTTLSPVVNASHQMLETTEDLLDGSGHKTGRFSVRLIRSLAEPKVLKVLVLSCDKLKSMETFGSNDVYVVVEWNGYTYKTPVHDNAGASTDFTEEVTLTPVSPDFTPVLKISVFDDNAMRKDVLIGHANISNFASVQPMVDASYDILDADNRRSGAAHVRVSVTPDGKNLRVFHLACSGLKSAEVMGKNDVYMVAEWSGAVHKTKTHSGAGASAEFAGSFILTPGAANTVDAKLKLSVFDDNTLRSDVCIGSVALDVTSLVQATAAINMASLF